MSERLSAIDELTAFVLVLLIYRRIDPERIGNEPEVQKARERSSKINDWSDAKKNNDWH